MPSVQTQKLWKLFRELGYLVPWLSVRKSWKTTVTGLLLQMAQHSQIIITRDGSKALGKLKPVVNHSFLVIVCSKNCFPLAFLSFCFLETGSHIVQAGFEFIRQLRTTLTSDFPVSTSQTLGLKTQDTTPGSYLFKFKFGFMFTNIFLNVCMSACGGHWSASSIVLQELVTLFLRDEVSHWVVELACWLCWLFNKPQRSSVSTSPRITSSCYLFFTFMWVFMIKLRSSCLYVKHLTYPNQNIF